RPAAATDAWKRLAGGDVPWIEGALQGLTVIEAANAEEEALAIAISLREAIETPAKTAALVTPDRALARRVLAALERWNVAVEDSAGEELADTPAGLFARLAAEAALDGVTPVALLALLKHPLLRLGAAAGAHARAIAVLEKAVLRGPRPRPGTAGLAHALTVFHTEFAKLQRGQPSDLHPRADLTDAQLREAAALLARLAPAAAAIGRAAAHLWSTRSAAAERRSHGARRPDRGHMAARNRIRSLAEPPHAPRARARSAGAAHFALRPRLRAGARRERGDPRLS